MFLRLLLTMILPLAASAQLVIKHQGQFSDILVRNQDDTWTEIDVDGDGVRELYTGRISLAPGGTGFVNVITGEMYVVPIIGTTNADPWDSVCDAGKTRSNDQAELAAAYGFNFANLLIIDIITGEELFSWSAEGGIQRVVCRDYDGDGLDDFFVFANGSGSSVPDCYDYIVVGSGAAYLPSPGPTLAIEYTGPDVLLSWASVPEADGYRVLWGAETDSPCFTQVGYTSGTSFLHTGFGDVPKGFYKVLAVSETGVPRGTAGEGRVNR